MSKDNNQDTNNSDYIPFPVSKKGKNGKNIDDIGAKHNPLFNPELEKALREDLNYDRRGSGNIAKRLIDDTSKQEIKNNYQTAIIEESPVPYNSAPKASVPHNPPFSNPKPNNTPKSSLPNKPSANMPAPHHTMSKEPVPQKPVDTLIEDAGHKDRFVPSHEAIVQSVVDYQSDDDKFENPTLLVSKTGASRSIKHSPLKKDDIKDASGTHPIKDEQAGKRFTVVLGALCVGLGIMLLIIYLFPPLVPIMGGVNNDMAGKTPEPAVSASPATPAVKPSAAATPAKPEPVKVYVVGAVKKPGVVSLPPNSRVDDAIKAAGGMTETADPLTINLAKRIKDEDQIIVREKNQAADTSSYDSSQYNWSSGSNSSYYEEPAPQAPQEQASTVSQAPAESIPIPADATKINLNGATSEDLAKISGIGPTLSEAIIDYRTNLPGGYFSSLEQLKDVPGIGDGKYEILCQHVDL